MQTRGCLAGIMNLSAARFETARFQVCCFLVGVFFIVCIIRKPTLEEREKEVNGKQTTGMAINSSGEKMPRLLQASRPAAEYARISYLLKRDLHVRVTKYFIPNTSTR
ncbi:uncharacterized protein M6G45_006672 isoform 2-T10 [Spheniscus humboldti]